MPSKIIILKKRSARNVLRVRKMTPTLNYEPTKPVLRFRYPETTQQG